MSQSENFGIYVHIPFCLSKCLYCSFISKPACENEIKHYIDFLCGEIKNKSNIFVGKVCNSIYFGGGTPSSISEKYIEKVLKTIKKHYKIVKKPEISIECNPCSVSPTKLQTYKRLGINRISFGVQSLNNKELKAIGRRHNSALAMEAILLAQEAGFENISADVMIGLPLQTKSSLCKTINKLVSAGVKHISAYMLILEDGTKLKQMVDCGQVKVANEDESVALYDMTYKKLKEKGFERYEISNFTIPGYECRHNVNYWEVGEYVGFGVSAHSYYGGVRYANSDNFGEYYVEKSTKEKISNRAHIEEIIMLGLRLANGVSIKKLNMCGYDILKHKRKEIDELLKLGLITISDEYIKITPDNFGVTSAITLKLI